MNYSKSIAALLLAGVVCVATPDIVTAQGHSRGRAGGGHSGGTTVGRAVPRGPAHVYGPARVYGPGRYYGPAHRGYYYPARVVGYAPYYPYYYPYRAGLTLGFYAGFGYPYGYASFGYGYPYGGYYPYGYRSYYGSGYGPYGYPLPPAGYVSMSPGHAYGGVRIQGAPLDAQVFVDGYYVGIVDDFDGTYQHLNLEAGRHQLEIRLPGGAAEPLTIDVNVVAGQTITYHAGITQ
jgi:hypothetical protein